MSALADRDLNIQPSSNPSTTDKMAVEGSENQAQSAQLHKQVLDQKSTEKDG